MKKTVVFSILLLIASATGCSLEKDSKTQPITYEDFIEKIWDLEKHPDTFIFKGNTAVIVDFYSKWCGPCMQLLPIMEKMADEYEGELVIYKVNVDEEKKLPYIFKVKGLPVMYVIPKNGQCIKRYEGLTSEENLRIIIEEQLLD